MNNRIIFRLLLTTFLFLSLNSVFAEEPERHFPRGSHSIYISNAPSIRSSLLENIAPIIERSIDRGLYPGAVVLAAHEGHIIYRGVFGSKRIIPTPAPMTFNTIFDIASLTKPFVTTTAIMQLVEQGKIDLDAPIGHYWSNFNHNGKANVTVRELLTHTSGFQSDLIFPKSLNTSHVLHDHDPTDAIHGVEQQKLVHVPGTVFNYSDVNFIALGHLVEIISGEDLNNYAKKHIFKPLGLKRTFYLPPSDLRDEIAPTQIIKGKLRWGEVHDDTAYLMGGVSGMAGIFSNAADLGTFAQCLLDGGRIRIPGKAKSGNYLLGPLAVLKMTTPQTPPQLMDVHGLGWDIDSKYSNRGVLFPTRSFGHTGWTGTSLWVDPLTQTWVIILTSRTHPMPASVNPLIHDRKTIANIIAASIKEIPKSKKLSNTGKGELNRAFNGHCCKKA